MTTPTDPKDYRTNNRGILVHKTLIPKQESARDRLVVKIITGGKRLREQAVKYKTDSLTAIDTFMAQAAANAKVTLDDKTSKGFLTLTSFDGDLQVRISVRELLTFNEQLQLAKAAVDHFITSRLGDSDPAIQVLVQEAFRTDAKGKISVSAILQLTRYKINDPEWIKAMELIKASITTQASKRHMRLYERDDQGAYQPISLEFSDL